ncbi:MAG TPA: prepilin-type N-terminal cleavage/methylation domain-containing protein [Vicinamibacterales bacterium]|nr:prepilin-type N-terminal cleavage/methylation domain-containing protein [Vicinamibacterales bacterium]
MRQRVARSVRGFSLIELLLTVSVAATLMAISVPLLNKLSDSTKLTNTTDQVEREMQTAKLRSVSTNTTMRFRTNCPSTGYYRIVEVLGTSADTAASRCNPATYPFKTTGVDFASPPNFDGVLRQLLDGATVTTATIEFHPDGTAWDASSGTATAISSSLTVTVSRNGLSKNITLNSLGKILVQ